MTDTIEQKDKPKKLTLSTSKLTLAKPSESSGLGRSAFPARSGLVTVEVKRGVAKPTLMSRHISHSITSSGDRDEGLDSRLNILKKAAESVKDREIESEQRQKAFEALRASVVQASEDKDVSDVPRVVENTKIREHHKSHVSTENDVLVDKKNAVVDDIKDPAKPRWEEPKKLRKNDIIHMLDNEGGDIHKTRSLASIKRAREKERRKHEEVKQEKIYREVTIPEIITVSDLASRMSERVADVIKELMKMGMIVNATQTIDADTAELVVTTMGHSFKRTQESDIENIIQIESDSEENLKPRAPVVTVMGHVDHGKTSLLDALRYTDIAASEAGGITQHIGAYRVIMSSGNSITFLDTPGHEAFTEMRGRGAKVTDIVVLVVAADDGIMAQTVEAINHAKAANVPIIVAINKIDKPDADISRVKNELLQHGLVSEDLGGDIIVVPVSALKRTNLDKLEEAILLVAEMAELKANPNSSASGAVVESRIDKRKGVIATLLVQRGTLRIGDLVVAGTGFGRVKRMLDDNGCDILECLPSMPVEIWGLDKAPLAGESFAAVQTEKQARDITEYRERVALDKKAAHVKKSSLEELFIKATGDGGVKELSVIIKGDVQGSIEAIVSSLSKLDHPEVRVKILHTAVGGISESDIALANASNAIVFGFNVRASNQALLVADKDSVDVRYYSIIYNLIDDVKVIMSGMLSPIIREIYIGSVSIREVFNITKVGKVAGSYVTKGIIKRGAGVRLLRDNIVIHEGKLKTLKRFKEEVKEVRENYECGIAFENYEDIKVGDTVEVFELVEEKQTL